MPPRCGNLRSEPARGLARVNQAALQFSGAKPDWKLGAISISILRKQFDKIYVTVAFDTRASVTMNFILVTVPMAG